MAIDLYSGTPGSGKSLHSAKDIIDCFRKGQPVIANFDVDLSPYPKAKFAYVEDQDLTPEFLVEFSRNFFGGRKLTKKDEDTILLVIDECQLLFNSRDYQKKDRKSWIKFFSLHRHFGFHIILIAQMDKMIDKQIRGLIEYEYMHRKLSNYGKAGKIITLFLLGDLFTAVQMWYPLKMKVGTKMFRAKRRFYQLYDSYSTAFSDAKPQPNVDQTAHEPARATTSLPAEPAQDETGAAAPLSDPEAKSAEVIQDKPMKRKCCRFSVISGTYVRPWNKRSLASFKGKFLRPGGRSETGWLRRQHKEKEVIV